MVQTITPETPAQAEILPFGWASYAQMQRDKRQYMRHCAEAKRTLPNHAGGMYLVYKSFQQARQWDNS